MPHWLARLTTRHAWPLYFSKLKGSPVMASMVRSWNAANLPLPSDDSHHDPPCRRTLATLAPGSPGRFAPGARAPWHHVAAITVASSQGAADEPIWSDNRHSLAYRALRLPRNATTRSLNLVLAWAPGQQLCDRLSRNNRAGWCTGAATRNARSKVV